MAWCGSVLTVLPLPFWCLLAGRAAQGVGLGLTALMMGVARSHLDASRASAVIALVSVASTIGIGVGYPLAGLLTELGGVRAAYGLGVFVTAVALLTAVRSMPVPPTAGRGDPARLDVPGAMLVSAGLTILLLVASETTLWSRHPLIAVLMAVLAVALLGTWAAYELRTASPLVDIGLLRHRAVAGANLAMLIGGIGMYLLLTLITRFAQTPHAAGYGFGLSTFVAALVLVPFSALGFVAGKVTPRLRRRIGASRQLAASAVVVLAAFALFALARSNITELLIAMAILGFGVGSFSAAMPAVILAVTPEEETSSAMSFNQVVRSVGFSLGSAVGGLALSASSTTGPWTPAVHALLSYLHAVGFHGAPRPLGIDEHGREILTFIPGTVAWPDHFHLLHGDGQLRHVARLIREFHDAVAGFTPPPGAQWQALIPADGDEIIAHHDLAPWNLIVSDPRWAFIDWDTAAPGTRLWDLAYAIHGFVPLTANPAYQRNDASRRLRLIADTYGLTERQRLDIIPLLGRRTQAMHDFLARQAAQGNQPWARLWQDGHGDAWRADTDYITKREHHWHQALLG